jgi:lipopolysaccharide/colanic/teichoic acid biosynthesis glycosyltransferase
MEKDLKPKNLPCSKVLFDRIVAFAGLLVLAPFLLIIAVMIKLTSKGPVIFRQERVGQYGARFTLYKFRTMKVVKDGNTVTTRGDYRITRIGQFLRKYKLDEIPELWNVLTGKMSIVGPRPDVPGYADKLTGGDSKLLWMKPGITGPASLKYLNEEDILARQVDPVKYNDEVIYPDKVRINIKYYEQWSFRNDLKFIWYTLLRSQKHET